MNNTRNFRVRGEKARVSKISGVPPPEVEISFRSRFVFVGDKIREIKIVFADDKQKKNCQMTL
jgi:hypothetical protein